MSLLGFPKPSRPEPGVLLDVWTQTRSTLVAYLNDDHLSGDAGDRHNPRGQQDQQDQQDLLAAVKEPQALALLAELRPASLPWNEVVETTLLHLGWNEDDYTFFVGESTSALSRLLGLEHGLAVEVTVRRLRRRPRSAQDWSLVEIAVCDDLPRLAFAKPSSRSRLSGLAERRVG